MSPDNEGHLLAISWAMPPLLLPQSIQISRLLNQWTASGWKITALTVSPASMKGSVPLDPELESLYKESYECVPVDSPERAFFLRALFWLIPALKERPDEKRLWAERAVRRGLALHAKNKFSLIISFAQPWSCHVAGFRLHQATGLPWIAHFSDPWTMGSHAHMTAGSASQAKVWETRVIASASRVVFVNQETLNATMARYPDVYRKKASVIAHGYDTTALAALKEPAPAKPGPLRLMHSGHFYGRRTPSTFLNALAELHRRSPLDNALRVFFIGLVPPDFSTTTRRLGLSSIVTSMGPKAYLETLEILRTSDALLLIEAENQQRNLYFPSKLVDYLMLQKPILGLTSSQGTSASILRQIQCPVVDPQDVTGIQKALVDFLERKEKGYPYASDDFTRVAQSYDIRHTAAQFQAILKQVLQEDAS